MKEWDMKRWSFGGRLLDFPIAPSARERSMLSGLWSSRSTRSPVFYSARQDALGTEEEARREGGPEELAANAGPLPARTRDTRRLLCWPTCPVFNFLKNNIFLSGFRF